MQQAQLTASQAADFKICNALAVEWGTKQNPKIPADLIVRITSIQDPVIKDVTAACTIFQTRWVQV